MQTCFKLDDFSGRPTIVSNIIIDAVPDPSLSMAFCVCVGLTYLWGSANATKQGDVVTVWLNGCISITEGECEGDYELLWLYDCVCLCHYHVSYEKE